MVKLDSKTCIEAATAHFSGLHFDVEYPAVMYMGANKVPFVIGVAGGTASGKATVCDMIIQQLHDHRVVLINEVNLPSFCLFVMICFTFGWILRHSPEVQMKSTVNSHVRIGGQFASI